jgi:hypothetical protein
MVLLARLVLKYVGTHRSGLAVLLGMDSLVTRKNMYVGSLLHTSGVLHTAEGRQTAY